MVARMTVSFDKGDKKILQEEAENQGRTFSGYIQTILNKHIKRNYKEKKASTTGKRMVSIKRRRING